MAVGWVANQIGDAYKNPDGALQGQYLAHKVAHALLGCAGAEAKGQDCAAGAIGGAVGEAFAEMYGGTSDGSGLDSAKQQEVLAVSKMVAAAAAGLTGKDAATAVDAAQLAVVNNWNYRELKFAIENPKIAVEIGNVEKGSNNISTVSERFAAQGSSEESASILDRANDGFGDEQGAFRHALWQGIITNRYGPAIAVEVGNAHENNPDIVNSGQRVFGSALDADQMVDLLNNIDGRNIGSTRQLSVKDISIKTIDFFRSEGLWTASQNNNGDWVVGREKISDEKYNSMLKAIQSKDNYGRWVK
jgi:hypothetical protein